MQLIPRDSILVVNRQRTSMDPQRLRTLRESIEQRGLFHPPLVRRARDSEKYILVIGERRLRAIDQLHEDGVVFQHAGADVPLNHVPVTVVTLDSIAEYMQAELDENLEREDLSWQDRDLALVAIHKNRQEQNPGQSVRATAREIVESSGGKLTETSVRPQLAQALVIADHLNDPAIAAARNHSEAYNLILQREEEAAFAELRRRQLLKVGAEAKPIDLRQGDAHHILPSLPDGHFDLILTDPPYGIGADQGGFRDRTVQHHNYDDTPESARQAIQLLLTEGWRICKTTANLLVFSDIDHFQYFKAQASAMGLKPFRTPVVWQKSESEGLAPWGRHGFRRVNEYIFYATKGDRGLLYHPIDNLKVKRVHRSERLFAAQKPLDLLEQLIDCSTLPGDQVLDPFMGSGSTLAAAFRLKRRGLGIELNAATFNTAVKFVYDNTPEADDDTDQTNGKSDA